MRVIGLLIGIFVVAGSFASSGNGKIKYRVTAYKKGNTEVVSVSNMVEVIPTMNIWVPSAFTPNGDGLNDQFGAKAEGVEEFTMQVFDRWGELVFECSDIQTQWDGTYKGSKVGQGTYTYQLFATSPDYQKIYKNGKVTVVN